MVLSPSPTSGIKVWCCHPRQPNTLVSFQVEGSETPSQFKQRISNLVQCPVSKQALLCNGKEVEELPLKDCEPGFVLWLRFDAYYLQSQMPSQNLCSIDGQQIELPVETLSGLLCNKSSFEEWCSTQKARFQFVPCPRGGQAIPPSALVNEGIKARIESFVNGGEVS
jgi:hypothetical protein